MKWKIQNQFLANYLVMFFISIMIGLFAIVLMDFANDVISKNLVKNNYTAESLMQEDYNRIDAGPVIDNGGGVQVIDSNYDVVYSKGLNTLPKGRLTTEEFTDFLISSKSIEMSYSYDIAYNAREHFWLVVTFPTSLRIDFAVVHNREYASADLQNVIGVLAAIAIFYFLLLLISTIIYSKITSIGIINPLRKLSVSAQRLRDGDYSARVDLHLNNEFRELENTFNAMAEKIEHEISLRKHSEENRKRLMLDISHDLKNPLANILGYAELCRSNREMAKEERDACLNIICNNSVRANNLITDLFELSKMESSEFVLNKSKIDVCEYLRQEIGTIIIPVFDQAGFIYEFSIPEKEIFAMLDAGQVNRVFQNLVANAVGYNSRGTYVAVNVLEEDNEIVIIFRDDGIGIPVEIADIIFQPFVRADNARNSRTGGTGLGLAIVEKIITSHGGSIILNTAENQGCEYIIRLPRI